MHINSINYENKFYSVLQRGPQAFGGRSSCKDKNCANPIRRNRADLSYSLIENQDRGMVSNCTCYPLFLQKSASKNIVFTGRSSDNNPHKKDTEFFNPVTEKTYKPIEDVDLSIPSAFKIESECGNLIPLRAEYDPEAVGVLYDKDKKEKFEVNILKTTQEDKPYDFVYNIMSKDLSHCYGYVWLSTPPKAFIDPPMLAKDYPDYGIVGDRLIVECLKNNDDKAIGGMGSLADKLEVKYCLENGIKNVVSESLPNALVAHYKRGKRFVPPPRGSENYNFMMEKYGNCDPDEVLGQLIRESNGNQIDLSGWENVVMYMPEEKFDEYARELE